MKQPNKKIPYRSLILKNQCPDKKALISLLRRSLKIFIIIVVLAPTFFPRSVFAGSFFSRFPHRGSPTPCHVSDDQNHIPFHPHSVYSTRAYAVRSPVFTTILKRMQEQQEKIDQEVESNWRLLAMVQQHAVHISLLQTAIKQVEFLRMCLQQPPLGQDSKQAFLNQAINHIYRLQTPWSETFLNQVLAPARRRVSNELDYIQRKNSIFLNFLNTMASSDPSNSDSSDSDPSDSDWPDLGSCGPAEPGPSKQNSVSEDCRVSINKHIKEKDTKETALRILNQQYELKGLSPQTASAPKGPGGPGEPGGPGGPGAPGVHNFPFPTQFEFGNDEDQHHATIPCYMHHLPRHFTFNRPGQLPNDNDFTDVNPHGFTPQNRMHLDLPNFRQYEFINPPTPWDELMETVMIFPPTYGVYPSTNNVRPVLNIGGWGLGSPNVMLRNELDLMKSPVFFDYSTKSNPHLFPESEYKIHFKTLNLRSIQFKRFSFKYDTPFTFLSKDFSKNKDFLFSKPLKHYVQEDWPLPSVFACPHDKENLQDLACINENTYFTYIDKLLKKDPAWHFADRVDAFYNSKKAPLLRRIFFTTFFNSRAAKRAAFNQKTEFNKYTRLGELARERQNALNSSQNLVLLNDLYQNYMSNILLEDLTRKSLFSEKGSRVDVTVVKHTLKRMDTYIQMLNEKYLLNQKCLELGKPISTQLNSFLQKKGNFSMANGHIQINERQLRTEIQKLMRKADVLTFPKSKQEPIKNQEEPIKKYLINRQSWDGETDPALRINLYKWRTHLKESTNDLLAQQDKLDQCIQQVYKQRRLEKRVIRGLYRSTKDIRANDRILVEQVNPISNCKGSQGNMVSFFRKLTRVSWEFLDLKREVTAGINRSKYTPEFIESLHVDAQEEKLKRLFLASPWVAEASSRRKVATYLLTVKKIRSNHFKSSEISRVYKESKRREYPSRDIYHEVSLNRIYKETRVGFNALPQDMDLFA